MSNLGPIGIATIFYKGELISTGNLYQMAGQSSEPFYRQKWKKAYGKKYFDRLVTVKFEYHTDFHKHLTNSKK